MCKQVAGSLLLSGILVLFIPERLQAENLPFTGVGEVADRQSGVASTQKHESFLQLMQRANEQFSAAQFDAAKKTYEEALAEGKSSHANKPDLAVALSDIAMIEKLHFHFQEAQDCLMDALPLAGDDQNLVALLQTRISSVLRARGNVYGALEHAKTALEIRTALDPKSPQLAESLNNVAVFSLELKDSRAAQTYCDQALALLQAAGKSGSAEEAAVLSTKAAAFTDAGKYDAARDLLMMVLTSQEKLFGQTSPKLTSTLNNLAMAYCKNQQYKEAEPYLLKALKLAETSSPQDMPGAADTSANLADLYARTGDRKSADLYFKKAINYSQASNYRHLADIKDQYQTFLLGEQLVPAKEKP